MSKLTDEEVAEMLNKLSEHFREPVMPVSHYCRAIGAWFDAITKLNRDAENKPFRMRQGHTYWQHLRHVKRDILKSNLLGRLIYGGEKLRTEECPDHKGRWTGGLDDCVHGCQGTGWLP